MKIQRDQELFSEGMQIDQSSFRVDGEYFLGQEESESESESELPEYLTELGDYSIRIVLSTGVVVILRDMTVDDLSFVNKLRSGMPDPRNNGKKIVYDEVEMVKRLISHLCIKWGDRESVQPVEIGKIRAKDLARLSEALKQFQAV